MNRVDSIQIDKGVLAVGLQSLTSLTVCTLIYQVAIINNAHPVWMILFVPIIYLALYIATDHRLYGLVLRMNSIFTFILIVCVHDIFFHDGLVNSPLFALIVAQLIALVFSIGLANEANIKYKVKIIPTIVIFMVQLTVVNAVIICTVYNAKIEITILNVLILAFLALAHGEVRLERALQTKLTFLD